MCNFCNEKVIKKKILCEGQNGEYFFSLLKLLIKLNGLYLSY